MTNFRGEIYFTPNGRLHIKDEPVTPIEEDFGDHNKLDYSYENDFGKMRKSMSMNDIAALREDLVEFEFEDREDADHRHCKPSGAPHELSRTKFVSMAEAIYHFQRDTPGRFHTKRPQIFRSQKPNGPSGLTVPQSPMLRSKTRLRPSHILSHQEREEMELEEIRKHKIKANPIPKSVIEGTKNLPEVTKKPITIPEPFKLTEIQKKATQSSNESHQFKARPAPKHILEKPHIPVKPPVHVTKPISPKFRYKRANSADQLKNDNLLLMKPQNKPKEEHHPRMGPLKPEPFSFEKRDEELKRRREERIKRQIEEERKQANLFKAQPVPGAVKKRMHCTAPKGSSSATSSENKENFKFEAKPPVVLYKEPFKPVLQPVHQIKAAPFELTTEKRAAERERYDKQLKEKEEEQERMRLLKEKEQEEAEERARAELRAKLIHHAKPVPKAGTAPFIPEKSVAPLTVPETPKFVRRLKQN